MPSRSRLGRLVPLVVLALFPFVAAAREPASPAIDPVVADVVRMLGEGVGPGVVVDWLETGGHRPAQVGADEVIALTRAGAPDDLIRRLVELARSESGAEPPATAGSSPRPAPTPGRLALDLAYAPRFGVEEDPWDLYVYLDGRYVTWRPGGERSGRIERGLSVPVSAGRHRLRLVQERHVARKGGRWHHDARVLLVAVDLDLEAGGGERLEVVLHEPRFPTWKDVGPLSWSLTRGGRRVAGAEEVGPATEDWPALCDDVLANAGPDGKLGRRERWKLDGCLRWADLWTAPVPSREEVRGELERERFQPGAGRPR